VDKQVSCLPRLFSMQPDFIIFVAAFPDGDKISIQNEGSAIQFKGTFTIGMC